MNGEDIIKILIFIISIICFIQSFTIEIIHINQDNLRKGFFNVVFLINTFECILYFSLILELITLYFGVENKTIHLIFEILFFFSNVEIILYNILTLYYLMTSNIKKDGLIESDMSNKEIRTYSISLQTHSFSKFHIISFSISFILTCFNFYNSLVNLKTNELYFFLLYKQEKNNFNWIFIIPCSFYLLFSIPYFFIAKNREEISDRIKIKNYSLYCLLSSIFLLIYASSHKIFHILKIEKIDNNILKFIYGYNYLFFLLVSFWYRENLYYASSIIYEGNNLVKRIINCLKIIFCIRKIKQFASIDYNNDFLLHALASKHDFMSEDDDIAKSFDQSVTYNN